MEKIEVYPYQRISSPQGPAKGLRANRVKKPRLNLNLHRQRAAVVALVNAVRAALIPINLILGLMGFILAQAFVLGELLPFVFAFMAALGRQDVGRTIILTACAAAGIISVTSGMQLWSNLFVLFGLMVALQLLKVPIGRQWWVYPLFTAAFLMVCKGLFAMIPGPSFYLGMVIVFEALIAGVLVFVFDVAGQALQSRKSLADFLFEDIAAFLIVAIGIAIGLNGMALLGLNLGSIFCRFCILLAAFLWGSGPATMVGVMAGLIPSLASSIFTQFLGMYALSGLLAGLFRSMGRLGVIMGFLLGNLALAMFVPETRINVLGIWETAIACLFFIMIPSGFREKMPALKSAAKRGGAPPAGADWVAVEPDAASTRMDELAALFEKLGQTFAGHPEQANTAEVQPYLHYLYDQVSQGICRGCTGYATCWGKDCYRTSQEVLEIFALVEAQGMLTYDECPPALRKRCPYYKDIINTVHYLFDNLRINEYWAGKLKESRCLLAGQLKGLSQIMRNLARDNRSKPRFDQALGRKLMKASREGGLKIHEIKPMVSPGGQLTLHLQLDSCSDGKGCEDQIVPLFSSIIGESMTVSFRECPARLGNGPCRLTLTPGYHYGIRTGAAQVGKEPVCGDSFTIATLEEGKQLLALSDGMGVGENASRESQAAIQLLENLLRSGFGQDMSLQTINSVLLLRSRSETFATLDLLVIDLYSGKADFVKTGSAPSFIKRKGQVQMIAASSLPMGILEEIEVAREQISLYPDDIVVMLSDGVVEVLPKAVEPFWIEDFLRIMDETDPQILAEHILQQALALCHGQPADDMTVICMVVERQSTPPA